MDFNTFFRQAMDRELPEIRVNAWHSDKTLNLGAGSKQIHNTISLDYPEWNADIHAIPYRDNSIGMILAYHFLEHCQHPVRVLQECQRVLAPGGHMNICVPYYTSQMQAHDLDHKHSFCEETWSNLFSTEYYDKNRIEWKFEIGFNLICGIVERNLCLLTQLIKKE